MADIVWLSNRLKAMSVPEITWRVQQKILQKNEQKIYGKKQIPVTERIFCTKLAGLNLDAAKLGLNLENCQFTQNDSISLFNIFDYKHYKKDWHAGFQTENHWPLEFSYLLEYKQRDDIGDARTNWELNRHFQFAILAKDYLATGDINFLNEFIELFTDWNEKNPFLWGISWTSVIEVAIRVSNWCYAYAFLAQAKDVPSQLLEQMRIGIINMTNYITRHYSRYSSANNHLIVEAYAIGQSGVLLGYQPWIDLAISILTRELPMQNYSDGVNKELSLHYQAFYMEAMGLMMRLMYKNGIPIPRSWPIMLQKMCKYVADCMGNHGEIIEFGDNDEGKILDLSGQKINYYYYVLGLLSCLLPQRYVNLSYSSICENLCWLFTEEELDTAQNKPLYKAEKSVCYREGGNSILRSKDGQVMIGIDHAALGFGSIAAHGHADALSFQMYIDGEPVFIDPGTYIYHCNLKNRNAFRKTENHNTVCIDGKDQSEMLGAFLWGKKAECKLLKAEIGADMDVIEAEHDGYAPVIHRRKFEFDKILYSLKITDLVSENIEKAEFNLLAAPSVHMKIDVPNKIIFFGRKIHGIIIFDKNVKIEQRMSFCSNLYGQKMQTEKLQVTFEGGELAALIKFERGRINEN